MGFGEALNNFGRQMKDDFRSGFGGGRANNHSATADRSTPSNSGTNLGDAIRATGAKMKDGGSLRERWKNPETRSKWARALGSIAMMYGAGANNPAMMAAQRLMGESKRGKMIEHLRGSGFSIPGAEFLSNDQLQGMIGKHAGMSAPGARRGGGGSKDPVNALKTALNGAYSEALKDGTISPEEQSGLDALKAQLNQANTFLNPKDETPKPSSSTFSQKIALLDQAFANGEISQEQYDQGRQTLMGIEADVGNFFDDPASPPASAPADSGGYGWPLRFMNTETPAAPKLPDGYTVLD